MLGWPIGGEEPGDISSQMIFYARNSFISAVFQFPNAFGLTSPDLDEHLNFPKDEGQTKIDSQQLIRLPLVLVRGWEGF